MHDKARLLGVGTMLLLEMQVQMPQILPTGVFGVLMETYCRAKQFVSMLAKYCIPCILCY